MTKVWKHNITALDFPDPNLPHSSFDFLFGPYDPAVTQQPANSQGVAHTDSSLTGVQHVPSVPAQDADSTIDDHTIAFTIVKKARITNAVITNCMIVNTVMNNPVA